MVKTYLRIRSIKFSLAAVLAANFGVAVFPANAQTVSYPDFAGACGGSLTCVGSAGVTASNYLQLTPPTYWQAGAAYSTTPVTLGTNGTFSTTFQFQLSNPGGIDPADGITFILAASPSGLGSSGISLGYGGVSNSVAVEFDTYNNGSVDGNSSNHIAIDINGNVANGTALSDQTLTNVYGIQTCGFDAGAGCLSNGNVWTANISYNGSALNVSVTDPAKGTTFQAISNYALNIPSYLGTNAAYVGFTAGTGAGYEQQNILNWSFASNLTLAAPGPIPGTGLLSFAVLALAGAATRLRGNRSV